jgi:hypothetical protein
MPVIRTLFAAATMLTLVATPAAAARGKVDKRVEAALACAKIAQADARLRCYDTTIPQLSQAVKAGNLIQANEATVPIALEGTVIAAAEFGFNRFIVRMNTGDRWEVIAGYQRDDIPKRGSKVTIKRGTMGSFWFVEQYMPERRAIYLGRSTL